MTIFKNRDMASTPSMPRNTATINPFKTGDSKSEITFKCIGQTARTLIKEEGFGSLYKLDKLQSHVLRYFVLKFAPLLGENEEEDERFQGKAR